MIEEYYAEGRIRVTSGRLTSGHFSGEGEKWLSIAAKNGGFYEIVEELRFAEDDKDSMIRRAYLYHKRVGIETGDCYYAKSDISLWFGNKGVLMGWGSLAGRLQVVSINHLVDFLLNTESEASAMEKEVPSEAG
jgi:hypothetical protein